MTARGGGVKTIIPVILYTDVVFGYETLGRTIKMGMWSVMLCGHVDKAPALNFNSSSTNVLFIGE